MGISIDTPTSPLVCFGSFREVGCVTTFIAVLTEALKAVRKDTPVVKLSHIQFPQTQRVMIFDFQCIMCIK